MAGDKVRLSSPDDTRQDNFRNSKRQIPNSKFLPMIQSTLSILLITGDWRGNKRLPDAERWQSQVQLVSKTKKAPITQGLVLKRGFYSLMRHRENVFTSHRFHATASKGAFIPRKAEDQRSRCQARNGQ